MYLQNPDLVKILLYYYFNMRIWQHIYAAGASGLRLSLKMSFVVILGDSRGFEIDLPGT